MENCHYSEELCLCLASFIAPLHPALSKAQSKNKGRNWVSSPQLIAVTVIHCVQMIQALPCVSVCGFYTLSPFALTHSYSSSVYQHISAEDLCTVLLCSVFCLILFCYSNISRCFFSLRFQSNGAFNATTTLWNPLFPMVVCRLASSKAPSNLNFVQQCKRNIHAGNRNKASGRTRMAKWRKIILLY